MACRPPRPRPSTPTCWPSGGGGNRRPFVRARALSTAGHHFRFSHLKQQARRRISAAPGAVCECHRRNPWLPSISTSCRHAGSVCAAWRRPQWRQPADGSRRDQRCTPCREGSHAPRNIATGHPYKDLISDLQKRGVKVELCGATAKAHGWGNKDLLPEIKVYGCHGKNDTARPAGIREDHRVSGNPESARGGGKPK